MVWFQFNLNYDLVQSIANTSDGLKTFAAMFSVNYADGLTRPDTTISVFDQSGNLILIGRNSDVVDAQPVPAEQAAGVGTTDLSQTSFGPLDPVIGTVQLPAGGPAPSGALPNDVGGQRTYYVAISSSAQLPTVLDGTFNSTSANSLVRLEPIDSLSRVVDDRIGSTSTTSTSGGSTQIFPGSNAAQLSTSATPLTLGDLVMYAQRSDRAVHGQSVDRRAAKLGDRRRRRARRRICPLPGSAAIQFTSTSPCGATAG